MAILKSKLISVQKQIEGTQDLDWITFRQGQDVPEEFVDLVKLKGGEFEDGKKQNSRKNNNKKTVVKTKKQEEAPEAEEPEKPKETLVSKAKKLLTK